MMIKRTILILLIVWVEVYSQSTILSPHPTEDGTRFSFSLNELQKLNFVEREKISSIKINSITVAGTFNNWNKNEFFMVFDSAKNYWYVDIPLKMGVEYHYKFVINDSIWITDPNAPNVTEDEWRNGIIIPVGFNTPYVVELNPPYGKRIEKLQNITCRLVSPFGKVVNSSVQCFLNQKPVKFRFDEMTNQLTIFLPKNLEEGEHFVLIKFGDDKGNQNEGFLTKFFLDRYKAKIKTPQFYDSAVLYEVFIRRFADSNQDGIGDFKGLSNRLSYLHSLGITALWLMPFDQSSKDHGYNVIDYYSIERDYGSWDEYFEFLRECKRLGIKVIKDIVINHCDTSFIYFRDAKNNPSSKYSNWFHFTDSANSDWRHFGIEKDMPKFNFENEEVQKYFVDFVKFWMDPNGDGNFEDGIDGIRCDAAKEIPHRFWNRLRKEVKKIRPDFLILGEVWDGANYLIPFFEDEFDMLFDYPFYYAIQNFFDNQNPDAIKNTFNLQKKIYPANFQMLRFLSNHDNHRALSLFKNDTLKFFQALVMIFTQPGTPIIYYGDEIGLTGFTPPENVRQFFDWSKIKNNKILELHRELISIRKKYPSLNKRDDSKNTSLKFMETNHKDLLCYLRYSGKEKFLVLINNSNSTIEKIKIKGISEKSRIKIIFALNEFLNKQKFDEALKISYLKITPGEALIIKILQK